MITDKSLCALDELIRARSILRHPFYLAWTRGELTREQLAIYARVYYPHVAGFPDYLRNAVQRAVDPTTKRALQENLHDELTNPAPHPELWLDFAEAVGVTRTAAKDDSQSGNSARTTSTFRRLTARDTVSGLAALYSYESQQPAVALEKMRGLRSFYGVTAASALAYFSVHASADIAHSEAERAGLARCLQSGESLNSVLDAAEESLDAYWSLLDGVMSEASIEYCAN